MSGNRTSLSEIFVDWTVLVICNKFKTHVVNKKIIDYIISFRISLSHELVVRG